MTSSNFDDVGSFKERFDLDNVTFRGVGPRVPREGELEGRYRHMEEELEEFVISLRSDDIVGMADALVDLVYVALGTAHLLGLPWQELWDEVQRANMSKVRGVGKRGDPYDVVKPDGWAPPRIADVLKSRGWDNLE